MLDPQPLAGPILVTVAYVLVYYGFQIHISRTKSRLARQYRERGERFDRYFGQDREMLTADRLQLNTLEHMPPFLVLLWLHAVFVSPDGATVAGAIYVLARLAYPLALGKRLGRDIRTATLASTVPGYLVLMYFVGSLVYALV